MRIFLSFLLFGSIAAEAKVISPSSIEVKFSFSSEFQTAELAPAKDLALRQVSYLFGYMQNPEIVRAFSLNERIIGIGAPRWEPEVQILADQDSGGLRSIRYQMNGLFLLNKSVAQELLSRGEWNPELPYDLDHYYDERCGYQDYPSPEGFFYFNDPFRKGCAHLRQSPLARSVHIQIVPAPAVPEGIRVGLEELRGDNGNGELFEIMSINGFNESAKKPQDDGRVNFEIMNQWFRDEGFEETVVSRFKNRPVHQFDKILRRADGSEMHARVTRLLVNTDLDESKNVSFVKFLKNAFEISDVVVYEGHSGMGVSLNLDAIEKQLLRSRDKDSGGPIEFDRAKHQIFFFDACSSYSYYLGMFKGRKDPGTLAVMTNGTESLFGYEIPTTKHFYRQLFNTNNNELTWNALLEDFEIPMRGFTSMLNVDLNN